ncbi:MAG TPA: PspC domain-containing protein [Acidimicrobiales bacterium]|nr:PspC domain-containing protein [Acidimicrobiales bacterium]
MTSTHYQRPALGVPQHPLRRNVPDAVLGGVCVGLACRLGVRAQTIRLLFALSCLLFGVGVGGYLVLWLALRRDGEDEPIARRLEHRGPETRIVLWSLVVVLVILLALSNMGLHLLGPYAWSVLLSGVGLVAVWRGASPAERTHLEGVVQAVPVLGAASARGWRAVVWRVVPATIMIVVGLQILSRVGGIWGAAVPALIGGLVLIIGILIMLAPWWLENVRDLSRERRDRVRAEERATLVTHVHDSVLQTLTLIERSAGDRAEVIRLARAQERELRAWLFAPDLIGVVTRADGSFADQLHVLQHDVERDYGVRVDLVVVGDCPTDQRVRDLVAAAREAAVNAAKWSGEEQLSIYGEIEPHQISVYVRDTGIGFDPDAPAGDRQGLSYSIRERVNRLGGSSEVRSTPGEGTEITLLVPRESTQP